MMHEVTAHSAPTGPVAAPVQVGVPGVEHRKLGMWLFIASEVMFFSGLIAAAMRMKWMSPADANHALNIPVTAVNTFVMIVSSTAVVLALDALHMGKKRQALNWMIVTAILGLTFVGVQVNEYFHLIRD